MKHLGQVEVEYDRRGIGTEEILKMGMPELEPINVILSGNNAIRTTLPTSKLIDSCPSTNYRGIALMSTCAKLYNRLLLGRIKDGLDSHLRQNQNGFRPLRSTGQHVLAWRRIYEEVIATKFASLFSRFIDTHNKRRE